MQTEHSLYYADAREMWAVADESVELVVTSPPYPMIEMWDQTFIRQNSSIGAALEAGDGSRAFEAMHRVLDPVWEEVGRVLRPGGFACINIGDAARKVGEEFMLYPNHARVLLSLYENGLSPLPAILWRKQTNAPNKFMGSGMLPAGAYVTLEHEYVLILRKGGRRAFVTPAQKARRYRSAIFWEERNRWFSDIWLDLKGTRQQMQEKEVRSRSGAFPLDLPYRLISMYSVAGDTVLDPFLGAGTTCFAAMAAARSSIGLELEAGFFPAIRRAAENVVDAGNKIVSERLAGHEEFVRQRLAEGKELKYRSRFYGFPVMTRQETDIWFHRPERIESKGADRFVVSCRAAEDGLSR
ncbi:MAG: site-specific DNA-methyltransferase [Desulfosalsimonadaceae bacterium]